VFRRVLIANRGEIAHRVIRACHALEVEAVVAHSEADRNAPWLEQADGRICIGPGPARLSYLNQDAILQAAEQCGCQAVHPGYGFLAENARFAARCTQQGLTFIGPTAGSIRRMGDKTEARRTMAAAGLPTIPGSTEPLCGPAEALATAEAMGYPVLLKARSGGGGRGLRRCADAAALEAAFPEAAREAGAAFGDPALYLERFVEGGRHVEFQVVCDAFGAAVHLGERECSIQRQHQKLVEEAPSPVVDPDTRQALGARVARAVSCLGYRGVGTVEFLRDPQGRFHFMEMNTRLQVEHPVTEMLTGIDLVQAQLSIAANRRLALRQEQVRWSGHAVELRINAEDPEQGFRPDPGCIEALSVPRLDGAGLRLRWDSAARAGWRIPPHYDSLIGKLIVHGPDRTTCLAGARQALGALEIRGVRTTIPFHRRVLEDPGFCAGSYDVRFVEAGGAR
jgi:acetyl-CoA carboxylase biotin carboxylase subunit